MQLEGILRRELGLAGLLDLGDHLVQDIQAGVNSRVKTLLLDLNDLADIILLLQQGRISAGILLNNRIAYLIQERLVDTEQLAVTSRTAEQTAQNVAASLVGRNNAVADHHDGGADMVGDNAERDVRLVVLTIALARNAGDVVGDVADGIDVKQRVDVLHDTGKTLQTHAGVDVLLLEFGIVVVAVVVKLGEYVVPDLHITVAVTADRTVRLTAAIFFAAVVVDLRARTARTGTVLPEVVLLAEAEDAVFRNADIFMPDLERLVVLDIDRRIQTVSRNAHDLGQELPAPGDGFLLEVVAEREVAQHLKVGAVARGLADVLDVAGTNALLAGRDAVTRRLLFPSEVRLHRRHAGVDEQQRLVALRDQRKARQTQMSLGLHKGEKFFTDFI